MRFLTRALTGLFLLSLTIGGLAFAGLTLRDALQERAAQEPGARPAREQVFAANVVTVTPQTIAPELVSFGQIEAHWQALRGAAPACARREAAWRIALLQGALRRRLLQRGRHAVLLNRRDPFRGDVDFTELDAMVERLWASTAIAGD